MKVPGDKSMTQRALILSALAGGESRVSGLLPGADPRSTAGALRSLGAEIPRLPEDGSEIRVGGRGLRGLREPDGPLDLGNSGTGARLLLGVLAGQPLEAVVTGDASLRSRPMDRVTDPLSAMGARFEALEEDGRLPLRVRGGGLKPLEYETPVASAQVKSSLLLAGLVGGVFVLLTEPGRSRDHTERMLRLAGVSVIGHERGPGWRVELRDPPEAIRPLEFHVPGDFSSAAYFLALGLLGGAGEGLTVHDVGLNPTRTGLLRLLGRMGGRVEARRAEPADHEGEPTGDLRAFPSPLRGTQVGEREVVGLIDEIPILAALAARAEGETRITGAGELRVKETDRIRALVENLRAVGARAEEFEDGLAILGGDGPLEGRVRSFGDHRIAMAFGVLGALPGNDVEVDDPGVVEVSFPGFWRALRAASGTGSRRRARSASSVGREGPSEEGDGPGAPGDGLHESRERKPVITIDGPAGSGKSTTAREVARRLGLRHLDSGALYRAITFALLEAGVPPERWEDLTRDELEALPLELRPTGAGFDVAYRGRVLGAELRSPGVTEAASRAARLPAVRERLYGLQRAAGRSAGLVADGRDMGTVVFPDADVKVFLTAELEERARRRLLEEEESEPTAEEIREEAERLRNRDRRDTERLHSPLRRPEDALTVDTTDLSFEEQVDRIVQRVRALTAP